MHVGLRHFEAFLAVARLGNFTRAAAVLHVSQPALTVQIRQLEEELGVRLFDRNNRQVTLTEPGREFVAPLERLMFDVASVVRHASDISHRRRGVVTVAALPSIASGVLADALAQVADLHHGIVVRVRDVVAGRVIELVKANEVDFGIGTLDRPDPDIVFDALLEDRLCAFVSTGHPLSRRGALTLGDLDGHSLILTPRDSSVRRIVDAALARHQVSVHVAHEPTYMSTALAMARAGLGVAVLPESVAEDLGRTHVRAIPVRTPSLTRRIGILRRAARSLSPAAGVLVHVLRAVGASARGPRRARSNDERRR